ncbi:hypothetical protein PIB30_069990 [Stylosanthes scabra]|uniref:Uncharacterized protein n=1 Tax=Stylosanthes scabra TaxID=79078 RepID=A0ABU6YQ86_9FABA|nr:hypothetical protein [Stylosanthes scabra]
MAYRRRQGGPKASTFEEDIPQTQTQSPLPENNNEIKSTSTNDSSSSSQSSSLAPQATKASATNPDHQRSKSIDGDSKAAGFWGVLAQRAKSMIDDDINTVAYPYSTSHATMPQKFRSYSFNTTTPASQSKPPYQRSESNKNNPTIRKGLEAITTSLNHLGDTFEKAFEEGRMMVENKTAELKTSIRFRGGSDSMEFNESNLKASRDVRCQLCNRVSLPHQYM